MPGGSTFAAAAAAVASRNAVPGAQVVFPAPPPASIDTLPPLLSAAFSARAVSTPGASAAVPAGAAPPGAGGDHGCVPPGSVAFSTVTPIISGSDHAATSYGRTMSGPATSFTSG